MAQLSDTSLLTDPNLKAYYKLENVNDTTANAFNLTNNGTVTFSTAKFSNGADLGATNTTKSLSTTNSLGIDGGSISVSIWVKMNAEIGSGLQDFVVQGNTVSSVLYLIRYDYNSGTRQVTFRRVTFGVGGVSVNYTIALGTSNFNHLVLTYNSSNSTLTGYVNKVSVGTTTGSGNGSGAATGFSIGDDHANGDLRYSSILIDDCAVFNRELTSKEVTLLYDDVTVIETTTLTEGIGALIGQTSNTADTVTLTEAVAGTIPGPLYSNQGRNGGIWSNQIRH